MYMTHRTRFPLSAALALSVAAALAPGAAFAQDPAATPPAEGTPTGGGTPTATEPTPMPAAEGGGGGGLTNAAGQVLVNANLTVELSKDQVAKPIYLIPNVYYGVSDMLTVGISHGGFPGFPAAAGSLCLGGEDRGCPKIYNNLNLDVLFSFLKQPGMEAAFHGGLDLVSLDPMHLSVRIGAALKFSSGPIGVLVDPGFRIAVTKRDERFDKQSLSVPVYINFQAAPVVSVGAFVAFFAPTTENIGDIYAIPVGAQGAFSLNPKMDLGAMFLFLNLAGKNSTADARALILSFTFRT
jgi:hypothetical protein